MLKAVVSEHQPLLTLVSGQVSKCPPTDCMLQETGQMHHNPEHNPDCRRCVQDHHTCQGQALEGKVLLHPQEYHPQVAINQLPGCQAGRVAAFRGHSTCRGESNTNPEGQPALASLFQKRVGEPGGRRVGSRLPALSAGKSCTGHLARSRWMYTLCSHWRCWHSSASPERSHVLCFRCPLQLPLWEMQPPLRFGNNLPHLPLGVEVQHLISNEGRAPTEWIFPWHLPPVQAVRG